MCSRSLEVADADRTIEASRRGDHRTPLVRADREPEVQGPCRTGKRGTVLQPGGRPARRGAGTRCGRCSGRFRSSPVRSRSFGLTSFTCRGRRTVEVASDLLVLVTAGRCIGHPENVLMGLASPCYAYGRPVTSVRPPGWTGVPV
jgi:hypothetical protein